VQQEMSTTRASSRFTAGFEYVGPPMDAHQARRLLQRNDSLALSC